MDVCWSLHCKKTYEDWAEFGLLKEKFPGGESWLSLAQDNGPLHLELRAEFRADLSQSVLRCSTWWTGGKMRTVTQNSLVYNGKFDCCIKFGGIGLSVALIWPDPTVVTGDM